MSNSPITYVIALYIRLSTEDSKVGSFSIENQKNALHQYVDAMEGVKNVEVLEFIDNGYMLPIIQSLAQLEKNYGKEGSEIIQDNCQNTIFGGFAPNSKTAEELSRSLGTMPYTFA